MPACGSHCMHGLMQAYAQAYLAAAVSYVSKMFMNLTPVVLEGDEVVPDLRPELPVVGVMKLSVITRAST